jgi:pantetheine-phosphate adenylyltransferase
LKKFNLAATGGTFDILHVGHFALLSKAFEIANSVIIGVTSDDFASQVKGKAKIQHSYEDRTAVLKKAIRNKFGDVNYLISKLQTTFGPAVLSGEVEVLVASRDTSVRGKELNKIRQANGLKPIAIVIVEMVKADDGQSISSTRIRLGQIDSLGKLLTRNQT